MPAKQARKWCATFFIEPPEKEPEHVRYAIYGKERCPDTHKIHWQSYIEFDKRMTMFGVKKLYKDKTVHLEIANGTREQARVYCKKDDEWTEHGDWEVGGQGSRTDIAEFVGQLKEGKSLKEVAMENPVRYCSNRNGLRDFAAWILKDNIPKWRSIDVHLFHGSTGTGKTRTAMESDDVFKVSFNSGPEWWCGYEGEKTICIDDYNNDMKINRLLVLLDGTIVKLPVKGSHTYAQWTTVYITTNLTLSEIHINAKDAHRRALFRRITHIRDFDEQPWVETCQQKDITGFMPLHTLMQESGENDESDEMFNGNNNSNINTKDLMIDVEMMFDDINNQNNHKKKKNKEDGEWVHGCFFPYEDQ